MKILLYNPNSFGGNYEYAKCLTEAYQRHPAVRSCWLVLPVNTDYVNDNTKNVLWSDISPYGNHWVRKIYFLLRSLVNPFIVLRMIRRQKPDIVIFNDYDQLTSLIWSPVFQLFKKSTQLFAVMLHDPDRDAYMPARWLSSLTMQATMRVMDIGFYHEMLPVRKYYQPERVKFQQIPHGIYRQVPSDAILKADLIKKKDNSWTISILGSIRAEKNYELAIEALAGIPDTKLIVAGKSAHSGISINDYRQLADCKGVSDRIIWIDKFLTDEEMSAVISVSDLVLLYYSRSFKSQSGILNLVAPYRKPLLVSDGDSALAHLTDQFAIGQLVEPDNLQALVKALEKAKKAKEDKHYQSAWDAYLNYASWDNHVTIALETYSQQLQPV